MTPSSNAVPSPVPLFELALLCLLALLWGSSYLFIRVAVTEIAPLTLIATRVVIAAAFLMIVIRCRSERLPYDCKSWRPLVVQAFLNSIAPWTLLAWAQQYVTSGLASVLNSTSPLFVVLLGVLWSRHESIGWSKIVGVCLGLSGVVMVVGPGALDGPGNETAGQVAALLGAALYAGAAIYGRRLASIPATVTAAATMLAASVVLVPASLIVDRPWRLDPSTNAMLAAATLGLLCTGVALMLYFRLLKTLGSLGVASQSYLRAGVGVALGVVVLGERFSATTAVGLVVVIIAVVLINLPTRDAAAPGVAASMNRSGHSGP